MCRDLSSADAPPVRVAAPPSTSGELALPHPGGQLPLSLEELQLERGVHQQDQSLMIEKTQTAWAARKSMRMQADVQRWKANLASKGGREMVTELEQETTGMWTWWW